MTLDERYEVLRQAALVYPFDRNLRNAAETFHQTIEEMTRAGFIHR